jgi:hypothetical protein
MYVQVWQTSTGHLLAECHINGKRAGWMILDTGASGFVIEPGVADQYELPTFGDLRIAGVAGKVSMSEHVSLCLHGWHWKWFKNGFCFFIVLFMRPVDQLSTLCFGFA